MKKKSTRGGKRPGSGRKETGRTTQIVSFSIPNDHVDEIRAIVKKRLAELKNGMVKEFVPEIRAKNQGSDYLSKRRNEKLGIKSP